MSTSALRSYQDLTGTQHGTIKLGHIVRRVPEIAHEFQCTVCGVSGVVARRVIQCGQYVCPNRACGTGPRRMTAADVEVQVEKQRRQQRMDRLNNPEPQQPQGITGEELDRRLQRDYSPAQLDAMTSEQMRKAILRIEKTADRPDIQVDEFVLVGQPFDTPAITAAIKTAKELRRIGDKSCLDVIEGIRGRRAAIHARNLERINAGEFDIR
jgi:hypothetical protein